MVHFRLQNFRFKSCSWYVIGRAFTCRHLMQQYLASCAALQTFVRVSSVQLFFPCSTREHVITDTPAIFATSVNVDGFTVRSLLE